MASAQIVSCLSTTASPVNTTHSTNSIWHWAWVRTIHCIRWGLECSRSMIWRARRLLRSVANHWSAFRVCSSASYLLRYSLVKQVVKPGKLRVFTGDNNSNLSVFVFVVLDLEKLPGQKEMSFEMLQADMNVKQFLNMRLDILLRCKPTLEGGNSTSMNRQLISRLVNSEINLIRKFKQVIIQ